MTIIVLKLPDVSPNLTDDRKNVHCVDLTYYNAGEDKRKECVTRI